MNDLPSKKWYFNFGKNGRLELIKYKATDFYHGAALTQIVEHSSFKALNKASEKYGHYLVNTDQHVFVKYTKASNSSPKKSSWQFTLQPEEKQSILEE